MKAFRPIAFGAFLALAFCPLSSATAAARKPVVTLQGVTSSIVGLRVDLSKIRANLKSGKLVVERACDASRFKRIATKRSPQKIADLYDFYPSAFQCRYRAKFSGSYKRKIVRAISNTLPVNLPEDDGTMPGPIPSPGATPLPTPKAPPSLGAGQRECAQSEIDAVVSQSNTYRQQNGLPGLRVAAVLSTAGRAHSIKMASGMGLVHDGFYLTAQNYGFSGSFLGQNIANGSGPGSTSGVAVSEDWYNSPGHKANMLNSRFLYTGVGCVTDSHNNTWWTVYFSN